MLLPLLGAFALGWLVELIIDWLFWRKRCQNCAEEADTQLHGLQSKLDGLQTDLTTSNTRIGTLEGSLNSWQRKAGVLAGAGGALGLVGAALNRSDKEFDNEVSTLTTQFQSGSYVEADLDDAQHEIARLKLMQNAPSTSTVTTDVSGVEEDLDDAQHEIARLKLMQNAPSTSTVTTVSSTDVSDLQAELDDAQHEIARLKLIQSAPAPVVDETELNSFRARVGELEADLENSNKLVMQLRTERDEAVEVSKTPVVDTEEVDKLGVELGDAQKRIGKLETDLSSSNDMVSVLRGERDNANEMVMQLRTEKDELDTTYKAQIADFTTKLEAPSEADVELGTVRGELDGARVRVGELEGDLNNARGRIGELEGELKDVNSRFTAVNTERDKFDKLVTSLRAEKDDLDVSYKSQIADFTSKLDASSNVESEVTSLRGDLDASKGRVAELENALGEANSRIKDANTRITEANERITELVKERDNAANSSNDELERMRAELREANERVAGIEKERDEANTYVLSLRGEKDQLEKGYQSQIADFTSKLDASSGVESELGDLRDELNNTRGRIGGLEGDLNAAQERAAELEKELKAAQGRVGQLEGQLNDADDKLGKLSAERDEANNLITSLRSEKDEVETTYKSQIADFTTKLDASSSTETELRKLSDTLDTTRSRIADLEKELKAAQDNVSTLESERDQANAKFTTLQTERDKLDVSYKAQIADYTSKLDASKSTESDLKDLRGELEASQNRVAELEKTLGEANSRIKDANSRISDANNTINQLVKERDAAVNQSGDELETTRSRIAELEKELKAAQGSVSALEGERDKANSLVTSLRSEKDESEKSYKTQIADFTTKLKVSEKAEGEASKLGDELKTTRSRIAELEKELKAAQGSVSALESERDKANSLVTSLRSEKDESEKSYKTQIADFTTKLSASSQIEKDLTVLRGNFDSSSKRVAELEKALGESNTRIKDANSRIQTANDNVKSLSSERDSLNKRIAELEKELKGAGNQAELDAANKRLKEVEAQLAKMPKFKWVKGKDDLQKLRGIGKVMEKRLHDAGVMTYSDIAKSKPEKLHEIAEVQAWQDVNTADWIAQAKKMKSADEVMVLEDGSIVGREGDEMREQINSALYEIERLKAEVKAKPKPPRPKVDKKMQAQLEAAEKKIASMTGGSGGVGARRRGRDRLQELEGITAEYEKDLYSARITSYYEVINATRQELIDGAKATNNAKTNVWAAQANEILAGNRTGRNWLQEIYGVGEEYETRLHAAGVNTYYDVANSTPEELKQIIEAGGETPAGANYEAWIEDAENILGNFFHTGFSYTSSGGSDEKDRLSEIHGIGKVYEKRLNEAGIYTFAQLAAADPTRVHEVCKVKEWQDHDTSEWTKQAAELARRK